MRCLFNPYSHYITSQLYVILQYLVNPKGSGNGQNCHSLTKNETSLMKKKVLFYCKFLLGQNELALQIPLNIILHCLTLIQLQNCRKRHAILFNSRFIL